MEQNTLKRRPAIAWKVVIVTGASSGIGEATALEFARAGATVVLAARRAERLERLAGEIQGMGGTGLSVPTDLTDITQITNLVQKTLSTYGRIDVLANIAGWGFYDWIEELSADELRRHYEVNVIGLAELIRQVVPTMKYQRSGFILNMSSYTSRISVPPLTVYASTKYAIEGLSDGLRRELLPWGVRVIRIHPSAVTGTEFNKKVVREDGRVEYRPLPIGRVSRESVARKIVEMVERPRRALFYSRLYEPAVLVNRLFPGIVDSISARWVRNKQREERHTRSDKSRRPSPLWSILGGLLSLAFLVSFLRKKR